MSLHNRLRAERDELISYWRRDQKRIQELEQALKNIALGQVMTQLQPWPDSAEDHLIHTQEFARRALEASWQS